jgi:hypothetical protein
MTLDGVMDSTEHPVVFGRGVRPFHGEPLRLRLTAATTFASGMALLCYQPQGR